MTPDDEASAALVVVIGQTVAKQLFGESQLPVGALIQVKGVPLRVIGALASKGQTVIRPGPGRPDDVPLHHCGAQSPGCGRADAGAAQLDLSSPAQTPMASSPT
ncbi:ABC transporter permease [Mesorhizobium japonicum]|uniref:ABC transporter permease n=1 Tax=Mesorhizobium japonicum TaxID=2066070 RepID=UPI001FCF0C0B|nr:MULTISPECIES: ABC transporter permease [Mesorhizobium]